MRPIKFRAWDGVENKMWSGVVKEGQDPGDSRARGVNGMIEWAQSNGFILMQFTGLIDKNGKEIYEGDIVSKGKDSQIYTVAWRGHSYGLMRKIDYGQVWSGFVSTASTLEIIGNIYENKDLPV